MTFVSLFKINGTSEENKSTCSAATEIENKLNLKKGIHCISI